MNFPIPAPLRQEHEALHEQLRAATRAGAEVGEAAGTLARLLHPHFVEEDSITLAPLALLPALSRGEATPEMAKVLPLNGQLEAELPAMLAQHSATVQALESRSDGTRVAGRGDIVEFAGALVPHARTEEEVMYPAAVLVGQVVRQHLSQHRPGPWACTGSSHSPRLAA